MAEEKKCGDRYRHLIRTKDGYTIDNRCGVYCAQSTVISWTDAARELSSRLNRAWKELIRVETGPGDIVGCGPGGQPEECPSKSIGDRLRAYFDEADDLPGWWDLLFLDFVTPTRARELVDEAVANMENGVCLLEQINDGIEAVGGTPPPVPPKPTKEEGGGFWDAFTTAVITTAVVVGAGAAIYIGVKAKKAKELGDAA